MNLTEPQAGSDLAAVRTRAVPQGDGTYKIFGTKIFITYGEHDMAETSSTWCWPARRMHRPA
jgi:alkylation response protein AidB-like acyl-CoA dehydrogenase